MPYVLDLSPEAPLVIVGDLVGWEEKLTSDLEPYDLNKAFSNGNLWLDEKVMPDRLVIDKRREWMPDGFRSQSAIMVASSKARVITCRRNNRPTGRRRFWAQGRFCQ